MTTITKEMRDSYTWDTADFTWDSLEADRSWNNAGTLDYALSTGEIIVVTVGIQKHVCKRVSEQLGVNERLIKRLLLNRSEWMRIAETYWDNILFNMHVVEGISLSDKLDKRYQMNVQEFISAMGCIIKAFEMNKDETIKFDDLFLRTVVFVRNFTQCLAFVEHEDNGLALHKLEHIGVEEFIEKQILVHKCEIIDMEDNFRRRLMFVRNVIENINVGELCKKEYGLNKLEAVQVFDVYIRACGAVLSNISIHDGELTLKQFLTNTKTPPGYNEFVDYKVGDYEYEQALVRLVMQAGAAQSEPLLYDVNVHVDIDDVDDRGTAEVTDVSVPKRVYYNKRYYTPPEVNITVKGGNTGSMVRSAMILTTSGSDELGRYFEAELLDASGNRVVGTFSWVAKGY